MKSFTQIYNWIYHGHLYISLPYYRSNVGTSVIFQCCCDCIENRLVSWSLFRGLRICLSLLLYNIYLLCWYILQSNESKYIHSNDSVLIRWCHHVNKSLHNPIGPHRDLRTIVWLIDWLIGGFFMPCQQHRPYSRRELFVFYSDSTFTQYLNTQSICVNRHLWNRNSRY